MKYITLFSIVIFLEILQNLVLITRQLLNYWRTGDADQMCYMLMNTDGADADKNVLFPLCISEVFLTAMMCVILDLIARY